MQKLVWQNSNGDEIDLTSGSYGITEWEGFSNTSLNIQSQQVPFQDGAVFLDALLNQRELSVTLKMQDNGNLEERYRMRRELIHILNPKLGEGYLIYTNDFISKRIKCVAQVPLFPTHNSNDSGTPSASLAWTACEPYWEDLEETSIYFKFGQIVDVQNKGDINAQMKIEFYSNNAINPSIIKLNDNKLIKYNGQLQKNLLINTESGKKEVYYGILKSYISSCDSAINDLCYSKTLGVIVCVSRGIIYYSYDGINWNVVSSEQKGNITAIAYSEQLNLFVAVSINSYLLSKDGIHWEAPIEGNIVYSMTYSEELGIFVSLSARYISKSQDGINWNVVYTFSEQSVAMKKIIYAEELHKFIGVGNNRIVTSDDGNNWTESNISAVLWDIVYSAELNILVAVGNDGVILTSPDGVNWTSRTSGTTELISSVAYSVELNLLVASMQQSSYEFLTSTDGINWTKRRRSIRNFTKLLYVEDLKKFINVGDYGTIAISEDGLHWDKKQGVFNYFYDVKIIKNVYYSLGNSDTDTDYSFYKSENGKDWEKLTTTISKGNKFTYSETLDIFVIVGNDGVILTSPDGTTWTSRTSGENSKLNDVSYFEDMQIFIIVGSYCILKSEDGINWNEVQHISNPSMQSVTYSKPLGLFVAVGKYIYTSPDGVNWTLQITMQNTLSDVVYSENLNIFLAVCLDGSIYTSPEGVNWNEELPCVSTELHSVCFSDKENVFVIVGYSNTSLYTNFIKAENQIQNISTDSDMNLNLSLGNNQFRLARTSGNLNCKISYRQKYIGV